MSLALVEDDIKHAPTGTLTGRRTGAWFSRDRIVCTCNKDKWLCGHVITLLLAGGDIGTHTVISGTTEGRTSVRFIPLTHDVLVPFDFTVIRNPGNELEFVIHASEQAGPVQAILTREDGLLVLVNALRNHYSRVPQFIESFNQIIRKKVLKCGAPNHSWQNNKDLADRIRRTLVEREGMDVRGTMMEDQVVLVAEEIALGEAYYLNKHNTCFSCSSFKDFSADVPEL